MAGAGTLLDGLTGEDFRDWNGSGTLVEPYPTYDLTRESPFGWHWGNRGSVSSAAIEKPHRCGWTPLLECEFDNAYSPLIERRLERGRVILCTLDLEARDGGDEPMAELMAARLVAYARMAPARAVQPAVLLGDDADGALLDRLGLAWRRTDVLPVVGTPVVLGRGWAGDEAALRAWLTAGGHAIALPRQIGRGPLGITLTRSTTCGGGEPPVTTCWNGAEVGHVDIGTPGFWSVSRSYRVPAALVKPGINLIAVRVWDHLGGGGFGGMPDDLHVEPVDAAANGLYHPDFRSDFNLGDNPYRYMRW